MRADEKPRLSTQEAAAFASPYVKGATPLIVAADSRALTNSQREIQREARKMMIDRWLATALPRHSVLRLAQSTFGCTAHMASRLIDLTLADWAASGDAQETTSIAHRREADRRLVQGIVASAIASSNLTVAIRGAELLCRLNGTVAPPSQPAAPTVDPELMRARACSTDELLAIAAARAVATRAIDVEIVPAVPDPAR